MQCLLRVKKLSEDAAIPARATPGSAGYDLSAAKDAEVPAMGKALVPTDLCIAVPAGTYGRIAPRSSLAWKHHIDVGAGVIDSDYRGNVGVVLFNHGQSAYQVAKGDRIAQLVIERIETPAVVEVEDEAAMAEGVRGAGGFGSTGLGGIPPSSSSSSSSSRAVPPPGWRTPAIAPGPPPGWRTPAASASRTLDEEIREVARRAELAANSARDKVFDEFVAARAVKTLRDRENENYHLVVRDTRKRTSPDGEAKVVIEGVFNREGLMRRLFDLDGPAIFGDGAERGTLLNTDERITAFVVTLGEELRADLLAMDPRDRAAKIATAMTMQSTRDKVYNCLRACVDIDFWVSTFAHEGPCTDFFGDGTYMGELTIISDSSQGARGVVPPAVAAAVASEKDEEAEEN